MTSEGFGNTSAKLDATEAADRRDVHKRRADEAWAVIDADHWRNRYDEDMARGNGYVKHLRARIRSLLASLRRERRERDELQARLDQIEDHVSRHYLDMRVGRDILSMIDPMYGGPDAG